MSDKTIDNEYTLLKSGTIIMIMYAVFIDKIKNTSVYQKIVCPKDTILINSGDEYTDRNNCATIIQTAVKNKINEKTSVDEKISEPNILNRILSYFSLF